MAPLFGEHVRRYFFGRVMHPPVSGSVQPSQTVFVPPVDVGKRPMARKVAFDETDDVFHPPLAFRILLAAHANLKSALPDVGGKFGRQNQIAVVFAYKQKMILVIDDLASHAAEKFKGVLVAADHIRRGKRSILPFHVFVPGMGQDKRDAP